jgi:hypothetical protein
MSNQNNSNVTFALTVETPEGMEYRFATAKELSKLVAQLPKLGRYVEAGRIEPGAILEDNSLGRGNYSPVLEEALRGMLKRSEIDYTTFKALKPFTM